MPRSVLLTLKFGDDPGCLREQNIETTILELGSRLSMEAELLWLVYFPNLFPITDESVGNSGEPCNYSCNQIFGNQS